MITEININTEIDIVSISTKEQVDGNDEYTEKTSVLSVNDKNAILLILSTYL